MEYSTSLLHSKSTSNYASALVHVADRVINIGLAPEVPEDLYMLIKKVCMLPKYGGKMF